jgi:uncharacterized Ntn-hydrolase superfamily protein
VTTSDLAVGARVPHAHAGIGVVVTQHRTDPRLGPALLDALRAGAGAGAAVEAVAAATPHRAWRQLAALDAAGGTGCYSGTLVTPRVGELAGRDCLAVGNMLAGDAVAPAMVAAFQGATGTLAARLLAGLDAGERAGGETGRLRSAALLVVADAPFPLVDLRIDSAPEPLAALAALWAEYEPHAAFIARRAVDPDGAGHRPSSTTTSAPARRAG